jgi:superoxide dismutase, Cu-Zn family
MEVKPMRTLSLISAAGMLVSLAACERRESPDRGALPERTETTRADRPMAQPPTDYPPAEPGLRAAGERRIEREAEIESFKTAPGIELEGTAKLEDKGNGVRIVLEVEDAPTGRKGVHIHELGDCSDVRGESMGKHFAPESQTHAMPDKPPSERHLGDLGNIEIGSDGKGRLEIVVDRANLAPGDKLSFLGKALVVHESEDKGETHQPSGGSGKPIACGVIEED